MTTQTLSTHYVDIAGRRHHVITGGSGRPTVVFEPAIGDVGWTWSRVLDQVQEFATVFTHDRPGLGDSDPVDTSRTVDNMVEELRSSLEAAAPGAA